MDKSLIVTGIKSALPFVEAAAEPQSIYGFFHGGDPRDFSPDPECSTEEEREAHRKACEAFSADTPLPGCCEHRLDDEGKVSLIITKAPFGLGTSHYQDADALGAVNLLRQALRELEREG